MSEIARIVLGDQASSTGPVVALLLFIAMFSVAVLWALSARRDHVERVARLPLEGEEETDRV
ncbi:MAG: hypothetical protein ACFCGT_02195 [Sandaracinaceae bacterium]